MAGRPGESSLTAADHALLAVLAPQVALIMLAARLNTDLEAARSHAVDAARQERARLRRDLRDGLGSSLADVALGVKAVEVMLQANPERTGQLLLRLRQEVQSATGEVRRILDDLRPESLGVLGLVAALRERANALCQQAGGTLVVRVDAPAELAPLPPEIETAAYKIGVEALNNVARHSGARTCIVQLRRGAGAGAVNVEISDDGWGLHEQRIVGLGLSTMGQRA